MVLALINFILESIKMEFSHLFLVAGFWSIFIGENLVKLITVG